MHKKNHFKNEFYYDWFDFIMGFQAVVMDKPNQFKLLLLVLLLPVLLLLNSDTSWNFPESSETFLEPLETFQEPP